MMGGLTKKRISDLEIERAELQFQLQDKPTLRDQFAMAAITGLISLGKTDVIEELAIDAYRIAEAMLEARNDSTEN